jgi:hypothetical protein
VLRVEPDVVVTVGPEHATARIKPGYWTGVPCTGHEEAHQVMLTRIRAGSAVPLAPEQARTVWLLDAHRQAKGSLQREHVEGHRYALARRADHESRLHARLVLPRRVRKVDGVRSLRAMFGPSSSVVD